MVSAVLPEGVMAKDNEKLLSLLHSPLLNVSAPPLPHKGNYMRSNKDFSFWGVLLEWGVCHLPRES